MQKRRNFLKILAGLAAGFILLLNPTLSLVKTIYARVRKNILPKNTDRTTLIDKHPNTLDTRNLEITPLEEFETMGPTDYTVDLNTWRLKITGYIKTPLELSYSQLIELPSVEKNVLLICSGVFAFHGRWKGISMKGFLGSVEMKSGATHITSAGPEGNNEKAERFPIKDILADKVFLAYAVNGKTLPKKHGFPLRVVAQDYYGWDWIKYVYRMNVEKM
jgi:sulfoxide reductase catalytic subunit YedY